DSAPPLAKNPPPADVAVVVHADRVVDERETAAPDIRFVDQPLAPKSRHANVGIWPSDARILRGAPHEADVRSACLRVVTDPCGSTMIAIGTAELATNGVWAWLP